MASAGFAARICHFTACSRIVTGGLVGAALLWPEGVSQQDLDAESAALSGELTTSTDGVRLIPSITKDVDDLQTEGSVSWSDQTIQLVGTVEDGSAAPQ